jgi:hypothetical protein
MIVTPFGLTSAHRGTALVTPSVVSVAPLKIDTPANWTTQTFNFASSTGNILVMFPTRSVDSNPAGILSVTWDGDAVTEVLDVEIDENGGAIGWAGWIRGGSAGATARDLVITATEADFRDVMGWAITLDRMAASPLGDTVGHPVRVVQAAHSVVFDVDDAGSRLFGLVASMDNRLLPFGLTTGWTSLGTDKTGLGGVADIAAILGTKVAGATGAQTMTATSMAAGPPTTDDWVSLGIEVLPA